MYQNTIFTLTYVVSRKTYQGWCIPQKGTMRTISDHELVFVTKGNGEMVLDGVKYLLKENTLVYFPPNVAHKIYTPQQSDPMHFYGVHFSFEGNTMPLRLPCLMSVEGVPQILMLFKELHRIYRQKDVLYEWRCAVQLQECLLAVFSHQFASKGTQNHEKMKRLLTYIHERPYHSFSVVELCNYSALQKTALTQNFRAVTGTTPLQYCQNLKLAYAKEMLLSQPDVPIAEVANICGFPDALYFSRCFKQHIGCSPRAFRNQNE